MAKKKGYSAKKSTNKNSRVLQNTKIAENSSPFVEKKEKVSDETTQKIVKPKFMKFLLYVFLFILTLIVVDLIVQYINNDYSVAIVNGYRIPRSEYEKRLDEAYGTTIATQLINEQLVLEQAQKDEVAVTEEEIQALIDETIKTIGSQEAFQSALEANGLTEETYRRSLRIQILAEKMVVDEPSDEDLLAYFEENKATYFEEDTVFEDVKEDVKDLYKNEKFSTESTTWLTNIRNEATIQDNTTEKPTYGLLKVTLNLLSNLNKKVDKE